jgi:hypothetical protein
MPLITFCPDCDIFNSFGGLHYDTYTRLALKVPLQCLLCNERHAFFWEMRGHSYTLDILKSEENLSLYLNERDYQHMISIICSLPRHASSLSSSSFSESGGNHDEEGSFLAGLRNQINSLSRKNNTVQMNNEPMAVEPLVSPKDPKPDDTLEECSICLENYGEKEIVKTPCDHVFHTTCFDEWRKKDNTCPFCRTPYMSKRCTILIFLTSRTGVILSD